MPITAHLSSALYLNKLTPRGSQHGISLPNLPIIIPSPAGLVCSRTWVTELWKLREGGKENQRHTPPSPLCHVDSYIQ